MSTFDCHNLLKYHLLPELEITTEQKDRLLDAREKIKAAISEHFVEVGRENNDDSQRLGRPRFVMQGSYVYNTLNRPAYPPEQQLDLDIGVYLPFHVLGDGKRPLQQANLYFEYAKAALNDLVEKQHGWVLSEKPTCVRVTLGEDMHIDVPLYAVPNDLIDKVKEVTAALSEKFESDLRADEWLLSEQIVEAIDPSVIYLAHRTKGWVPSDAIVIRDWASNAAADTGRGTDARSICRYLKAWRDERWQDGTGPSSIFLLAHNLKYFDGTQTRHCSQLGGVIEALRNAYAEPLLIPCPTAENPDYQEDLRSRVSEDKRLEYQVAFNQLADQFCAAKGAATREVCNRHLIDIFGSDRIPWAPDEIKVSAATVVTSNLGDPQVKPLKTTQTSTSG